MSSAGRCARGGGGFDFWPTPPWCVDALLDVLDLPGGRWVEPSAGSGAIIQAVNARRCDVRWLAVEQREETHRALEATGASVAIGDFLTLPIDQRFDVAILNPPFSHAFAFVRRCLDLADHVVAFERAPWIGDAAERADYFRETMPDEYRLGRVCFDGKGTVDSVPSSWFYWRPGDRRRTSGSLTLLRRPPPRERVAAPLAEVRARQGKLAL